MCSCSSHMAICSLFSVCEWKADRSPAFGMTEAIRSEITVMIIFVSHSIPNMLNKRNRHGNLWDKHVFHPSDLWICLDSYTKIVHWYMIYIQKSDWWGVLLVFICIKIFNWWEKKGAMVICPFRHWLSCTGCFQHLLDTKCTLSTFVHLPRMFLSMDFLIENKIGVITMDLFISY